MANDIIIRGKDRLQEISMKLEQSHLVYLQTDDSPLKLQQRHKLEGFIKEYLCLVPNENKYVFQETADILHRSAATVTDFSGYRAATAWSAISLYAANLLAQPWRKEYRIVRVSIVCKIYFVYDWNYCLTCLNLLNCFRHTAAITNTK